LCAL